MKQNEKTEVHEFDIDNMPTTTEFQELHQEGNRLIGVTKLGVRFSQGIKPGKLLTKEGGKYRLIDRDVE